MARHQPARVELRWRQGRDPGLLQAYMHSPRDLSLLGGHLLAMLFPECQREFLQACRVGRCCGSRSPFSRSLPLVYSCQNLARMELLRRAVWLQNVKACNVGWWCPVCPRLNSAYSPCNSRPSPSTARDSQLSSRETQADCDLSTHFSSALSRAQESRIFEKVKLYRFRAVRSAVAADSRPGASPWLRR